MSHTILDPLSLIICGRNSLARQLLAPHGKTSVPRMPDRDPEGLECEPALHSIAMFYDVIERHLSAVVV